MIGTSVIKELNSNLTTSKTQQHSNYSNSNQFSHSYKYFPPHCSNYYTLTNESIEQTHVEIMNLSSSVLSQTITIQTIAFKLYYNNLSVKILTCLQPCSCLYIYSKLLCNKQVLCHSIYNNMADWMGYYMPSVIVGIYACDLRYLLFKNHMEKNTNTNLNLGLLF